MLHFIDKDTAVHIYDETILKESEIESVINKLKCGKSIGVDFVSNEMLKYMVCVMI